MVIQKFSWTQERKIHNYLQVAMQCSVYGKTPFFLEFPNNLSHLPPPPFPLWRSEKIAIPVFNLK